MVAKDIKLKVASNLTGHSGKDMTQQGTVLFDNTIHLHKYAAPNLVVQFMVDVYLYIWINICVNAFNFELFDFSYFLCVVSCFFWIEIDLQIIIIFRVFLLKTDAAM